MNSRGNVLSSRNGGGAGPSRHRRLALLDRKHVWHPFTQMRDWLRADPVVIVAGRGARVRDARGKWYLDANSSIWTNLHGHRHPSLTRALKRQLDRIAHASYLGLANEPASLLAARLTALAPRSLTKVFYSDNGSTALEVALKMAFQFRRQQSVRRPAKRDRTKAGAPRTFLTLESAYHGDTVGAMSLGGIEAFHGAYQPLLFRTQKVMAPYCYRCPFNRAKPERADARDYRKCNWECVGLVEKALAAGEKTGREKSSNVERRASSVYAAAVIEPLIQGAAGMVAHPRGYLQRFAALCREHRVPLILDEVLTGFGRTGTMFACEQERVQPDFLCLAKGLTGGYLPLAATLTSRRIFDAFLGDYAEMKTFFHGHSFTGNALGCAAALASLDVFKREKTLKTVAARGAELEVMLRRFWKIPVVGDIRRVGLIAGIELVRDWRTRAPFPWAERVGQRVCAAARREGVLTRPIGNVLVVMPPYCVTSGQLEKICAVLERSIRKVCCR